MSVLPKPIAVTKDKVVLSRKAWDAIIEAMEDFEDIESLRASAARRAAGKDDSLDAELYRRLRKGEHPVRIWREQRKMSLSALAEKAGMARAYLSEIESSKKPGSVAALQRLAEALALDIDDLVRKPKARRTGR